MWKSPLGVWQFQLKMHARWTGNGPKHILNTTVARKESTHPTRQCKVLSTTPDGDIAGGDICGFNMSTNASAATCAASCCANQFCDGFVALAPGRGWVGGGTCPGMATCPIGGSCCYLKSGGNPVKSMYPHGDVSPILAIVYEVATVSDVATV